MKSTKERLLEAINIVAPLEDYTESDCIFSAKYNISATSMVYILKKLADDFHFTISDAFVDAMEMCTFSQFETLLEEHENTQISHN